MIINKFLVAMAILIYPFQILSAESLDDSVNSILSSHYATYAPKEYFSGIAVSVYKPGEPIKDYFIGQESHDKESKKIDANTLFEIGSITKSFTAALILQLKKESLLHTRDTIEHWLPEYEKWSSINITSLLNMTNGLPNYSDSPLMNAQQFSNPERKWKEKELIRFAYPDSQFSPPLKTGFFYTNTGYVLTGMIIELATQHNFQTEIQERLLKPADLQNTFYPIPKISKQVMTRLAHGYGFNPYTNPELVGKDVRMDDLSWSGAAGALLSNSTDVIKWVKALFVDDKILDTFEKKELMKLNSTATGKAIEETSATDKHGFGLGVSQGYDQDIGRFWYYEGQTEGFRALYIYVPATGIILSCIFNSSVESQNDHAHELLTKIYGLLTKK
jgi:D-alanyl-D-alanine carboxypeptidase